MYRKDEIPEGKVAGIIRLAFAHGATAYERYSELDNFAVYYKTADILIEDMNNKRVGLREYFDYSFHFPDVGGDFRVRKINLKQESEYVNGATWREVVEGWGLIIITIKFDGAGLAIVDVYANSEKRANAWSDTLEDSLGKTKDWNWAAVTRHCRRLIGALRASA